MKNYQIKYVDGYKIRQLLDADFNVLHTSNNDQFMGDGKWYIPKGEVWLDYHFQDEEKFIIEVETTAMVDYSRSAYQAKFGQRGQVQNLVSKEDKRDNLTIQWVDGSQVRRYLDPLFVMGGHDLVYDYIPAETIWIEQKLDPRDFPHVLKHELFERELMSQGKKYDNAHDYATAAEKESRRVTGGAYPADEKFDRNLNIKDFYVDSTTNQETPD